MNKDHSFHCSSGLSFQLKLFGIAGRINKILYGFVKVPLNYSEDHPEKALRPGVVHIMSEGSWKAILIKWINIPFMKNYIGLIKIPGKAQFTFLNWSKKSKTINHK